MELGILSLGDLQRDLCTGRPHRPVDRMTEILGYTVLADQLGLDVFALGEHHSAEFFTSSPAVVLAAAAARTTRIRLTSATTLLGVADPVRVYEDFASLDLISRGRAEIIVGRSAFVEPFALFGYDTADYDALFSRWPSPPTSTRAPTRPRPAPSTPTTMSTCVPSDPAGAASSSVPPRSRPAPAATGRS